MPGKVLTVASGKGGVGKTTTAVNLAVALWREGNAVALVDADLGMANLAAVLGLEPEATLHDVLSGEATAEEAVIEAKGGDLLVLPGERELAGFANADPGKLRDVLSGLAGRCDYVLVDTGAGLSYEDVLPLGLADEVLLVTTPDPAAVGDTKKTLELAGLVDGPVSGVVVTRALADTDAESIAAAVGVDLLVTIPEDAAVTESVSRGDPLESHAPDAPATLAYRELARSITNDGQLAGDSTSEDTTGDVDEIDGGPDTDVQLADGDDGIEDRTPDGAEGGPGGDETDDVTSDDSPDEEDSESGDEASESTDVAESEDDADEDEPDGNDGDASDGDDTDAGDEEDVDESETDESDETATATDDESEAKRGGVLGWLGRLFS